LPVLLSPQRSPSNRIAALAARAALVMVITMVEFSLEKRRGSDDSLWAVVAIIGRVIRIAEIFPSRPAALADQAWRESQVRAYAHFLERSEQPIPRYTVRPIRRTDLPRRWKPLPALGFLNGQL